MVKVNISKISFSGFQKDMSFPQVVKNLRVYTGGSCDNCDPPSIHPGWKVTIIVPNTLEV